MSRYPAFGKIPRWNRDVVITEKIDGTNGVVGVIEHGDVYTQLDWGNPPTATGEGCRVAAGSRKRWISPDQDNHGFARFVWDNAVELSKLGPGLHYGEWYGSGINRGYGLTNGEKHFMLFNTARWGTVRPLCTEVSTVLWTGPAMDVAWAVGDVLGELDIEGSRHRPGFMNPEGIVLYHTAANALYKMTLHNDTQPKRAEP